jgi:uncharacterized protein YfdQ (DUF2303 family)
MVIIYRPDILLVKKMDLDMYDSGLVYCNNYADREGDFRWVLSPRNCEPFSTLLSSIELKSNHYKLHEWIRDWFDDYLIDGKRVTYVSDHIIAGVHEEVLRKIATSGISLSEATQYGVSQEDYNA